MEKSAFVYIETYGCSANSDESQIISGLLSRAGHEIVRDIVKSDIIIINTCSVKSATVNKILFRINEFILQYPDKKIIVTGCLPETESEALSGLGLSIVSTNHIRKMPAIVSDVMGGKIACITGHSRDVKLCLPKIRDNPVIDIVPICSGCASACSFCATRLAKGRIFSYPEEKIMCEIESARKFGTKEFWITGQDVSAYGMDEKESSCLPGIIEEITSNIKGRYFIRIGMMNPANIIPISNELLKAFRPESIFKFIHIPVQSGSNRILRKMNRNHTVEDFEDIVSKFRRHFPKISVWTDIIVGFPEETDEDFQKTLEMIQRVRPDFVNISQFSCHRKTPAASMKQVASEKKKERSSALTKTVNEISMEQNQKWIGWQGDVLIDEFKKEKGSWIARNFAYKPVVLSGRKFSLGTFANVKITGASETCLFGEVI